MSDPLMGMPGQNLCSTVDPQNRKSWLNELRLAIQLESVLHAVLSIIQMQVGKNDPQKISLDLA